MDHRDIFILHIETSTKVCSVCVAKNGQHIATVESSDDEFIHGEKLTLFIEDCLNKSKIELKLLSAICISAGPGSYTGLRIGVSTAKGLCYGLKIPLISVNSLESLYELARINQKSENICVAIDARRMEIYSAIYNESGQLIKEISSDLVDEASYDNFTPFHYCGDGAEKLQSIWNSSQNKNYMMLKASAEGMINLAYKKYISQTFEDVAYFEPFYLKEFFMA